VFSYLGAILLHEVGHAYCARRLGYPLMEIRIGSVHGVCAYDAPENQRDESIIAWGGVLAQLVVAIPLIVLAQTTPITQIPGFGPIVVFLGYLSVGIALINLIPTPGLDGYEAWKLFPILWSQWRWKGKRRGKHIRRVREAFEPPC